MARKVKHFEYFINLDERGEFRADVRLVSSGETVWQTEGFEIFEDGFMKNKQDLVGLKEYLVSLRIMGEGDELE